MKAVKCKEAVEICYVQEVSQFSDKLSTQLLINMCFKLCFMKRNCCGFSGGRVHLL